MRTFPIMLNLGGRRAVVVGSGPVGLRKTRALLRAGAMVRLVTGEAHACKRRRHGTPRVPMRGVSVVRGQYHPPHVRGAALVFACTDDREVNARIAADARRAGALVNAADQPEDCDFFLPAVVADGEVVVAVGTGGASPSLAGGLKRKLKRALPRRIGAFASLLGRLREELRRRVSDPRERMRIMKVLSGEASYRAFRSGGPRAVRARMRALTNE